MKRKDIFFFAVFALIVAVAAYLRVFEITTRPPHSDEGVNFLFIETTNRQGYYPYSHENYHGPLFFYLITWLVNTFGDSILDLRLGAILSGVLTIILIAAFVPLEGWLFVLVAGLLAAVSPSLVFFSRYAIHEPLLVLETLALALCCLYWCKNHRVVFWYLAGICAAALIATKETFPICVLSIGLATLTLREWKTHWAAITSQRKHIFGAYLLAVTLVLFIFSAGFRWPDGIREMFRAIPQWIGRSSSDVGHFKHPLYYVTDVMWVTEPYLLAGIVGALGLTLLELLLAFVRDEKYSCFLGRRLPLAGFLAVWTLFSLLIYSIISYKTVWLIINITLPATLFLACVLTALLEKKQRAARASGIALISASAFLAWGNMLKYNFVHVPVPGAEIAVLESFPYGPKNPFSYVHTAPGMLTLVGEIESYWKKKPDARVLVGVEGYFPLPYYFRNKASQCAYFIPTNVDDAAKQYDIMILDFYKNKWSNPDWTQQYNRLSDYAESNTYFKKLPNE